MLPPRLGEPALTAASMLDAETNVLPLMSSITCADVRHAAEHVRRGRSFEPDIRFRCRSWMRTRRSSFVLIFIFLHRRRGYLSPSLGLCPRLAGLLLQHLTGIPDALLL
jgi:hypothetical protein